LWLEILFMYFCFVLFWIVKRKKKKGEKREREEEERERERAVTTAAKNSGAGEEE
jgi:preprotein translocase subunit SecG